MTLFWKKIEVIKNDFMKYMIIRKNMIVFYNYFFRGKINSGMFRKNILVR